MKQRLLASLFGLAGVLAAGSALAAEDDKVGLDLGLRLGYALPMGSLQKDVTMSDYITGQVPIWVDAGYRFTPNIMAGLYFQYGFAFVNSDKCPSPASCSAHDMRLGIQGQYKVSPGESVDPWFGLGVGLEWLGTSTDVSGQSMSSTGNGLEFLNLQGGADFNVTDGLDVGPFLSFSLGQFNSYSYDCSSALKASGLCGPGGDIKDKALHEWLTIGVRGVYGL